MHTDTQWWSVCAALIVSYRHEFAPTEDDIKELTEDFQGIFKIPENFTQTAEKHNPNNRAEVDLFAACSR